MTTCAFLAFGKMKEFNHSLLTCRCIDSSHMYTLHPHPCVCLTMQNLAKQWIFCTYFATARCKNSLPLG